MGLIPYIGVTGLMTQEDARAALAALPPKHRRLLMLGVLASSKTLRGETNNHPGRYPKVAHIDGIFLKDPKALNMVHFASDSPDHVGSELDRVLLVAGSLLRGVQLNMCWPKPELLRTLQDRGLRVVLQIGKHAMEKCRNDMTIVCDRLAGYDGIITDVLIDGSGGRGALFSPMQATLAIKAIAHRFPDLGIGVAGGLHASTLVLLDEVVKLNPDVSIDAEGRLRDESDALDRVAMAAYIETAATLLR